MAKVRERDPDFHFQGFPFPAVFHQGSITLNCLPKVLILEANACFKGAQVPFTEATTLISPHVVRCFYCPPRFLNTSISPVMPLISRSGMDVQEMEDIVSGITPTRVRADPSACVCVLNPLLNAAEGRKFLSKQEGERASVLVDLFEWVAISLHPTPPYRD